MPGQFRNVKDCLGSQLLCHLLIPGWAVGAVLINAVSALLNPAEPLLRSVASKWSIDVSPELQFSSLKTLCTPQFFTLLTSKCASRHNGMHFFDNSTSKRAPKLRCFVHFDLETCFAPQRRALFRHLNSTSKSGPNLVCFVHYDLEMCFVPRRATFHLSSAQRAPHSPL